MEKETTDSFLSFFNEYNSVMLLINPKNGKILNANKAAVEYYAYSLDVLKNMTIDKINTLSANQIYLEHQNALKQKRNHFYFTHRLASGEIKDVKVHTSPIEHEGKKILLSIIYDMSYQSRDIVSLQNDLDSTLAAIPDLLFELGLDGYYHSVRANRTELLAESSINMLGKTIFDILPLSAANICFEALQEANEIGYSEGKQFSLFLDEKEIYFELSISRKSNIYADGPRFIVLSRDITKRKEIEKEMKETQYRFIALHEASSGGIAIHEKGVILECNNSLCKLFDYTYEELIGMNGLNLISKRSLSYVFDKINNAYEEPYEAFACTKDGKEFPIRIESREIIYKGKNTRVTEFNNITKEKKMQEELKKLAHYDSLTNLPNRALFADRLQQALIHSKRHNTYVSVVYIDIDGFKEVNDTYGHEVGDKLLIGISENMKNALREEDTIARFGGDEFVATIVDLHKQEDCYNTLKRLLKAASNIVIVDGIKLQVSASVGVSIYPLDSENKDMLLRYADAAMYKAKQNGKNRYHIYNNNNNNNDNKINI